MKAFLLLKNLLFYGLSSFYDFPDFPPFSSGLTHSIQQKNIVAWMLWVKPLENGGKKQHNGRKWRAISLIMIGISFSFILISCGARGPLYLPKKSMQTTVDIK
ncbi:MAG: hypothetical protein AB8Z26_01040 [Coxiella-like endosymbiont]